jgi:glycosyltransferase involved in cell wall biosynthesis
LVPELETIGGVGNYYNALRLHHDDGRIEYFQVNGPEGESIVQFGVRVVRNYWSLWRTLGTGRFGLVLVNPTLDFKSFFRDSVFVWIAKSRNLPILVFFRGWDPHFEKRLRDRRLLRTIFDRTYARSRDFIVLGRIFKQKLLALGCSPNSRFWVESTVADSKYLANFSITTRLQSIERVRILFLARLTRAKGAAVALEAFRIAQWRRPDLNLDLVIAGPGPEFTRLKSIVDRGDIANVTLAGTVRGFHKAELLASSHILLHPTSSDEGVPNSILEAMLYGMPILTTSAGAIPEVVQHEFNGFVADGADPDVFADWIIRLAADPELRQRMALANHTKALADYTDTHVRLRLKAIIDECLGCRDDGTRVQDTSSADRSRPHATS